MELWAGLTAFNAGVAGEWTEHMLWRLGAPEYRNLHPANVVLQIGGNNLWNEDSICAVTAGVAAVVGKVRDVWPDARILYVTIPPRRGPVSSRFRSARAAVNDFVAASITPRTINADAVLRCPAGDCGYYQPDHFHLAPPGHAALTLAIKAALLRTPE